MTRSMDRNGRAREPRAERIAARRLRMALGAGLAAAAITAVSPADAQFFDSIFGQPYYGARYRAVAPAPAPAPANPYYHKPKRKKVEATKTEPAAKPGPLLVAISINAQRLTLYSAGAPIAHAPVSTGVPGHPTPLGIFSVIGKERFHRSNLYSNAPMPWMQRITWSGVALHQGVLPGYPASHGCIRLPGAFAQYLWGTTRMGARVIITRDEVTPFPIEHANLFAPKPQEPPADRTPAQVQGIATLKIAETSDPAQATDAPAQAAAIGVASPADAAALKLKGSLDTPTPQNGGKRVAAAAEHSDVVDPKLPSPTATDTTSSGEAAGTMSKPGRAAEAEAKETPHMSEPVSVFVSRKAGRLYVRQGFEPVFDTPVIIRDPEAPIGTHLYTASELNEDRSAMRWTAVTLAGAPAAEPEHHRAVKRGAREEERPVSVPTSARLAASAALDRVQMPKEAVDRISELLSPGSSLIISDYPLSGETGKYTDFIILTR